MIDYTNTSEMNEHQKRLKRQRANSLDEFRKGILDKEDDDDHTPRHE